MRLLDVLKGKLFGNPERWVFLTLVLLFLGPVFATRFFATNDGIAHAYNAEVISRLLFGDKDSALSRAYELNSTLVPNWFSHFLLIVLQGFLKAESALKVLHALYMVGIAYGFRFLMLTLNPGKKWAAYFVFPFVYNFFFFMGFYNFLFSLVLFFFMLGMWIRIKEESFTWKIQLLFIFLFALIWFTHLAGFVLLVIAISSYEFISVLCNPGIRPGIKAMGIRLLRRCRYIAVPLVIPAICTLIYYAHRNAGEVHYREVASMLTEMKYFIAFTTYSLYPPPHIEFFTIIWFVVPLAALALFFWKGGKKYASGSVSQSLPLALTLVVVLFAMCFTFPDEDGSGTMIISRIIFLVYLFIPFLLAAMRIPPYVGIILAVLVVWKAWDIKEERSVALEESNKFMTTLQRVGENIEPGSTFTFFNFDDSRIIGSVPLIAVTGRSCVSYHNYEATTDYFPVRWNKNAHVDFSICDHSPDDFNYAVGWFCFKGDTGYPPDYILLCGDYTMSRDTANTHAFVTTVQECYSKIAEENTVSLYRKNK